MDTEKAMLDHHDGHDFLSLPIVRLAPPRTTRQRQGDAAADAAASNGPGCLAHGARGVWHI